MILSDIIKKSAKPELYQDGTAFMWTDSHIANQLLNVHLNPDIDLASRKQTSITKTVDWILNSCTKKGQLQILDLGCGPGLYAEKLAEGGHEVTGVDISETSIEYAKKSAKEKSLSIDYICSNYLQLDLQEKKFDLVIMIFTDFGVLKPNERSTLLNTVYGSLKTKGVFIFDVLKDTEFTSKVTPNNWEASRLGFWKPIPHLVLSHSFLYEQEKVILFQHLICSEDNHVDTYRFWTHFFSESDVAKILVDHNFSSFSFNDSVLPDDGMWNGNNVIFTKTSK